MVTLVAHSSTYCPFPCVLVLVSSHAREGSFGRTFLDLSAPAGRSVSVSILAKHGAVHDAKFYQLQDIVSCARAPQLLKSMSKARFSPVSGPSNDWPLCA